VKPRALLLGRVRLQTLGSWEETDVLLDGVWRATTSSDGWIVILDVDEGLHVLEARHKGYLSSQTTIDLVGGVVNLAGETLLLSGDTQPDDVVNMADLMTVESAFGLCTGSSGFQRWIDADNSGCVDAMDIVIVHENFGRRGPTRWTPVPAPLLPLGDAAMPANTFADAPRAQSAKH
jgi:hypothetical protein